MIMEPKIIKNNKKEYLYDDGKIIWNIKLNLYSDEIIIEINDTITNLDIYSQTYTLNSLYEKDVLFKKVKTIDDAFSFLNRYFENKNFKLIKNEQNDSIIIQIKYNIEFIGENIIELLLSKKEVDIYKQSQKALDMSLSCNKEIISLKNENNELKQKIKELEIKYKNLNEQLSYFFEKELENLKLFNYNRSKICHTEEEIEFLKIMLPNKKLNLLYRATEHGDSTSTFHSRCDNKGENIVFFKTSKNRKFGGHTCKSWKSSGGWNSDNDDPNYFLFNLSTKKQYKPNDNYFKDHSSLFTSSNYGPLFGPDYYWIGVCEGSGNILGNGMGLENKGIPHLGINNPGYEFTGEYRFTCVEVEVYQVID